MRSFHTALVLVCASVVADQARAERTSTRLTPGKSGDHLWSFTVKVERLREAEAGEFLEFRVTATPTAANTHPLPRRSAASEVFHGKEFVSSCGVQPAGPGGELTFSFRVAAKYVAKSRFMFGESVEHPAGVAGRYYWFHLGDFVERK